MTEASERTSLVEEEKMVLIEGVWRMRAYVNTPGRQRESKRQRATAGTSKVVNDRRRPCRGEARRN